MKKNIGILSFRIAGTDGVSLEIKKWITVLEDMGHQCFFLAGELDTPKKQSYLYEELHFLHPIVQKISDQCFGEQLRPQLLTESIHDFKNKIKLVIIQFIRKFNIDLLIAENILSIPINLPFSIALAEVIQETGIKAVGHHHDFFWERPRFMVNCIWDYLNSVFPPALRWISHTVINSSAQQQLALRRGISSLLIPNVMDFKNPPTGIDEYNKDLRKELGVADDELFVLQPTRIVPRKGIEHAIEVLARLPRKSVLVISHSSGDEGNDYLHRVEEYARFMKVKTIFKSDRINETRSTKKGKKIYALQDLYPHADFVTYPSLMEGFGNAFLETVYFRKPILINNYPIYAYDIKPLGFKAVEIEGFVTQHTVDHILKVLDDPRKRQKMVDTNYELGKRYFSYHNLKLWITSLIISLFGNGNGNSISFKRIL